MKSPMSSFFEQVVGVITDFVFWTYTCIWSDPSLNRTKRISHLLMAIIRPASLTVRPSSPSDDGSVSMMCRSCATVQEVLKSLGYRERPFPDSGYFFFSGLDDLSVFIHESLVSVVFPWVWFKLIKHNKIACLTNDCQAVVCSFFGFAGLNIMVKMVPFPGMESKLINPS